MAKVSVTFTGEVVSTHVWVAGDEVSLVYDGTKWSGSRTVSPWPMTVRMRFIAPTGTDWALVIKRDGKKVLEESDTSDHQIIDKTWTVGDAPIKLVQDLAGAPVAGGEALAVMNMKSLVAPKIPAAKKAAKKASKKAAKRSAKRAK